MLDARTLASRLPVSGVAHFSDDAGNHHRCAGNDGTGGNGGTGENHARTEIRRTRMAARRTTDHMPNRDRDTDSHRDKRPWDKAAVDRPAAERYRSGSVAPAFAGLPANCRRAASMHAPSPARNFRRRSRESNSRDMPVDRQAEHPAGLAVPGATLAAAHLPAALAVAAESRPRRPGTASQVSPA